MSEKQRIRGTCWSITINNYTKEELEKIKEHPGWKMEGQEEIGEEGTVHYQGMLCTPQVWFSAVKKALPRAHIELAKNRKALEKYVHKPETRVAEVDTLRSDIPTLFDYQHQIANKWNDDEWDEFMRTDNNQKRIDKGVELGDIALEYVDSLVANDIENGMLGVEYIAINPMWRSAWKRFWRQMVARERRKNIISNDGIEDATD